MEDHELAEEWHSKGVTPEAVLIISLGSLFGVGLCTQLVKQNTVPVLPLILMGVVTLGTMMAFQSTLADHMYISRP